MIAREIVRECARRLRNRQTGKLPVSEPELLLDLAAELRIIVSIQDWDWNKVYLDPAVQTVEGQREYDAPANFPQKFLEKCAKLNDGSAESELGYESPEAFYEHDLESETPSQPTSYTVITAPDGRRRFCLRPTPDDDSYTVTGLYAPTEFRLTEMSQVPPVPHPTILEHAVLRRYLPGEYEQRYQADLAQLMVREGRNRNVQMIPQVEEY